jgi:argininosuccinate lyase/amino-acid N-acetyltransferase
MFESGPDELFKRFNDSLRFDHALLPFDVQGSLAWARALHDAGVLSQQDLDSLSGALREVATEYESDPDAARLASDEDVHSFVERQLIERVGDLGKKLHTGRSRNDQVATDLKLYTRSMIDGLLGDLLDLRESLVELAERHRDLIIPGFTHLQLAQPVLFAHWCLAYEQMLERDADRLRDARSRLNRCPLGCGALAGTAYPIDRQQLAEWLGFDGPTRNSLDTVSDRDHVIEVLSAAATCSTHLSRISEDLIIYASTPYALVTMSDAVATGSSLMPQKKNPDALELLRGKSGRIVGSLVSMLMTVKGLPMAYNKDMQEDKEPLFDAAANLSLSLKVMKIVLDTLIVNEDRCEQLAAEGFTNATDLADYLVSKGIAFRDSHDIVGRVVRAAMEQGVPLQGLDLKAMTKHSDAIESDVYDWLTLEAVVSKRDVIGGTAPTRVHTALDDAKSRIDQERSRQPEPASTGAGA